MTITESNGTFTFAAMDTNTTYSAGTGLQLSGNTFSTKLNSTTSLGTIGTTAKLYAVGVDANGKLCVNVPWTDTNTDTHYTNYLQIKGNGTEAVKFTQNADKSLNLKPGSNVSISAASGEITISATVPTKSSWNYDDTYVKYSAAQSLNDTQKTQARTNIGAGTITEIKVNGTSKGTSGSVNLTNMVTFASSQTATVAGTNKTTYTYGFTMKMNDNKQSNKNNDTLHPSTKSNYTQMYLKKNFLRTIIDNKHIDLYGQLPQSSARDKRKSPLMKGKI